MIHTICRWGSQILAMAILTVFVLTLGSTARAEESRIEILFIHNNPCESCDEEGIFKEILAEKAPKEGVGSSYEETTYYAYRGRGYELVEEASAYFGFNKSEVLFPLVIIGDQCLAGYDEIKEKLFDCLTVAGEAGMTVAMPEKDVTEKDASSMRENIMDAGEDVIHLLYFHTEACPKCEKAEKFFEGLPEKVTLDGKDYPVVITKISVATGENALVFSDLAVQYGVPEEKQQVPFLFLGDAYLSGEEAIRSGTEELLESGKGLGAVYRAKLPGEAKIESPVHFWLKTVGVGFLNGFNPCALSLVLLFFSLLNSMDQGFLKCGLTFLTGKFTAYTLLGLAAATALSAIPFTAFSWMRRGINVILLVLCVTLAIGNFLDCYHSYRGEYGKIRVQLPTRLRGWNNRMVKKLVGKGDGKAFLLLIFGGSAVIALGEFFCTGQIYLASILQWIQRTDAGGVPVLAFVLYSAALCLPSLVILILVNRGKSALSLADVSLKGMPLIKLCNGILFLIFAFFAVRYF